jgi:Na+-transporting NADH:ubiquinone oxidoreductase subunit B
MPETKKTPLIAWLGPMKKVLYALVPASVASIYFFGWRTLMMIAIVNLFGFLAEYVFARHYKQPVNSSVFVTNLLFALTLPPSLPFRMAGIGIVFAVVFGKMVFGGFGKNIFNPALVGRAFIYVTFAGYMTGTWVEPSTSLLGGLLSWQPDAVTSATVLTTGEVDSWFYLKAFLGNIPGSLGETSALAILIGGIYLYWKKIANRSIIHWTFISMVIFQAIFRYFDFTKIDPLTSVLAGGFMLGLFFMATDPVSAPKKKEAQIVYGIMIGTLTSLIRTFSVWPEGMMFAILLANMFAPVTDLAVTNYQKKKKAAAK